MARVLRAEVSHLHGHILVFRVSEASEVIFPPMPNANLLAMP